MYVVSSSPLLLELIYRLILVANSDKKVRSLALDTASYDEMVGFLVLTACSALSSIPAAASTFAAYEITRGVCSPLDLVHI